MSQRHSESFFRFTIWQRLEHIILLLSFTVLSITGIPQKYVDTSWAVSMIQAMGGIEAVRQIHRAAAIVLMLGTIYHGGVVTYKVLVARLPMTMLPGWQDVKDAFHALAHNVGLTKTGPLMGRFTFGEKAEYWAVVWGTVIMIITGFMLWNPIATARFLPGQFIPAAKAAHGGEAVLAVLSILTWHAYNVHVKVFNKSMFTGKISRHEMVEEHPLELAEIEAGVTGGPTVEPETLQQRRRVFVPVAVVISTVLLIGLYLFVTFEQTAITTVPRQEIETFVPATPTPVPDEA
jgi:cytochrome b subunit of formate dehydrogenase